MAAALGDNQQRLVRDELATAAGNRTNTAITQQRPEIKSYALPFVVLYQPTFPVAPNVIGELFTGIVEGVSAIAQLLAESVTFAGNSLGKPPQAGEAPLSARRVSLALAPLALLVSIIGGICGWCWWCSYARTNTQATVVAWADRLARDRLDNGRFNRFAGNELPVKDWWGQPLQVEYVDRQVLELLVVRSLGSDGIAETNDDIESSRRALLPKELAGAAIKEVGRFALEHLKRGE